MPKRLALIVVALVLAFAGCDPSPPSPSSPSSKRIPAEVQASRDPVVRQFIAAVRYQQILEYAAAIERAEAAEQYRRLLEFAVAYETWQQQQAANSVPSYPWDALARCESGGRWGIATGNGYYGGIQFSLSSWRAVGGTGYPHHHSREEQIRRGIALQRIQGWGAWPSCSRKLGLR